MPRVVFEPNKVTAHKMPDDHVALILPPNVAQCLADMMGYVGGDPRTTRRGFTSLVSDALREVGFRWDAICVNGRVRDNADMAKDMPCGFTFEPSNCKDKRVLP
jgi:hypothetical protein